ncbi:uncharacterized protein LOC127865038 [Dreissena polymorpha]|uniref:Uncharacterized protein n=1 Tax=Dreissena polymorpha TaxID=45954 RepID=A0A9D4MMG8_DREPO|nr:uncharacterized protein LOC127865038 [Dreissena polymorpha]XP_052260879.1 uncharacterized protein LOC127865038 [Dreissena polymorpha]XP_052260880.1 uncharacterized protein LOC127865038 [Dreissena polymorpha]KAH3880327.1 hypothetical protein DPMN_004240 [Dreissena polymorpha]
MATDKKEDVSQLVLHDELDADTNHTSPEYVNPTLRNDVTEPSSRPAVLDLTNRSADNNGFSRSEVSKSNADSAGQTAYYNARDGNAAVGIEVVRMPSGIRVIRTQDLQSVRAQSSERPIKLIHIKRLKVFAVIAIVVFFPLGIPAYLYAFRAEIAFQEGLMQGNIDLARKLVKRSERCIIFAFMSALLVVVAVVAIVERQTMENNKEYFKHRAYSGV